MDKQTAPVAHDTGEESSTGREYTLVGADKDTIEW